MKPTWRPAIILLASLAVMVPWPLVGIALTRGLFDQPDEAVWLFGGVTGMALAPLALVVELTNTVFWVVILGVWCIALVVPAVIVLRIRSSRTAVAVLLSSQAAFSLVQAAMGALMILGKDV